MTLLIFCAAWPSDILGQVLVWGPAKVMSFPVTVKCPVFSKDECPL